MILRRERSWRGWSWTDLSAKLDLSAEISHNEDDPEANEDVDPEVDASAEENLWNWEATLVNPLQSV